MRIQHNIMAMSAYRNYTNNVSAMKKNLEKLSSGYKINRAGDDAAGLAISEKMRAQITGLETAQKNAKDGISLVQTAEGALTEVHDMLNRMVELATQSANGTYDNTTDRAQMQKEIDQLRSEIDRIADSSNFNGIKLLDGTMSSEITGVVSSDYTESVTTPGGNYVAVGSAVAWATGGASSVASLNKFVLHSNAATEDQVGEFTIDLSQLKVNASTAGGNAKFTLQIGNAAATTVTIKASAGKTFVDGSDIAKYLAGSKGIVFVVSGTGTGKIIKATGTARIAQNSLVYKAEQGTGSKAGFVTFKAYSHITKTGGNVTYASAVAATIASNTGTKITASKVPAGLTAAQANNFDLQMQVKVSGSKVAAGWQNQAVTESKKTTTAGNAQFGNTAVRLDKTKITDGMKLTIGIGSGAVRYIQLGSTAPEGVAASKVINLSAFGTSVTAAQIASAIANSYTDPSKNGGVVVGAQGSYVTLSEFVNGDGRTSIAATAVQDAMKTIDGFKTLMGFEKKSTDSTVYGNNTLTIDPNRMRAGQTLEITSGRGIEKFQFVASAGASVASGATAVVVGSQGITAEDLKTALASKYSTNASVSVVDGKVTVKFTDTASVSNADASGRLLTGESGLKLQIGDTADAFNQLVVEIADMHTNALGIDTKHLSIANQDDAAKAVDLIKNAINQVSDLRGTLGATQNRLDHTINNLSVMQENIQDAESTIRDVDVAEEMMAYTKNNILIQSAQAMLAQANQVPQGVLQLLQ